MESAYSIVPVHRKGFKIVTITGIPPFCKLLKVPNFFYCEKKVKFYNRKERKGRKGVGKEGRRERGMVGRKKEDNIVHVC